MASVSQPSGRRRSAAHVGLILAALLIVVAISELAEGGSALVAAPFAAAGVAGLAWARAGQRQRR